MQLREIDKVRYSKHYRIVFAGIAFVLLIIAPATSALFISLFSNPEDSYFFHNLAGVVVGVAIVAFSLTKFRQHPYLYEVVYVWDLKQQLNRIHRKQRKIEAAIENNDNDAMIIMNFMLRGSKQLYELDDNTITMEDLLRKIQLHDERMQAAGLSSSTDSYNPAMLERF
ncbi:MAG: DUF3087 domain-containing protein [Gammaproteobacteria bacterium]|nr:DUF3087 domain-containing protein [Gammaproteobacteria bacterium]MDH5661003.1 DUF3087 domain-containing protein [Gammaproteobacteria bacterium]